MHPGRAGIDHRRVSGETLRNQGANELQDMLRNISGLANSNAMPFPTYTPLRRDGVDIRRAKDINYDDT